MEKAKSLPHVAEAKLSGINELRDLLAALRQLRCGILREFGARAVYI
jgi:hypothetical protein